MLYWNPDVDGGILFAGGKLKTLSSWRDVEILLDNDEPNEIVSIEELCRLSDGKLAKNLLVAKDRVSASVMRHANKVNRHKRWCYCISCAVMAAKAWRSVNNGR